MASQVNFESFSIQNADNTDTASVVLSAPSGTVNGNLMIALIAMSSAGGRTLNSVPSGWIQIQLTGSGGGSVPILGTYYKVASSESGNYTWGFSSSNTGVGGCIIRLSDVDTSSPVDTSNADDAISDGGGSAVFTNTITPSGDGMIIFAGAYRGNNTDPSGYAIVTNNPTWTERVVDDSTNGYIFSVATAQRPETSATGNSSLTIGGGSAAAAHLIYVSLDRSVTIAIDSPGILALSGNDHDFIIGNNLSIDAPGTLTLNGNQAILINEENTVWTEETKNPSSWTEENK